MSINELFNIRMSHGQTTTYTMSEEGVKTFQEFLFQIKIDVYYFVANVYDER